MKRVITQISIFICLLIPGIAIKAQVVTVTNPTFTTPALAATYTSLANAVTALNGITAISGVVTITLNPGNLQIAPAGGYVINFTSPTTAAKRVIITGSNNTILSNGSLASGTLTDAFFKVVGVDFLTIQNFAMQENPANTTSAVATNNMTEWGVALLYASATNGAQNNTIQNNTITLNKNYSNTFGIYSNTRHTATTINITADVTSTAGANSNNNIYGNAISNVNMGIAFIGSGDAGFMDLGNDIGGASVATANTITNWGGLPAGSIYISNSGSCYGIFLNNQKNETASFNTITSATVSGTSVAMRGIFKTYATVPTGTFTSSITNNVIRINHNFSSGVLDGIRSEGISTPLSTATININDNRFQTMSVLAASSSTSMVGITNTSQCGVLNMNNNIFRGNNSTATTGGFTAISNTGAVQTTVNINGNQIGDASGNAITFSAATSGALTGITCPTIAAGAALSISNNNFQGFVQSVAGSGAHTYITYTHAANTATTDNINSNTFTNLVANTSADVNFISRSGTMAVLAGATNNCNNNNIVTGFSKPVAGGVVTLYNSSSGSLLGNTMVQTGNDFSNITLTGATTMNGWSITEGGLSGPTKTISNNVFSNWICGTNAVTVLSSNFGDNNTIVSGNTISSISAAAAITAISLGNSNKGTLQTCSGNTIADLTSTGGSVLGIVGGATTVTTFNINNNTISGLSSSNAGSGVTGIRMLTASTANVFKNKIYDLSASNATGTVSGLDVFGTALGTYNINNNLAGDLRADLTNSTNAIRGINLLSVVASTAYNVFYNTVYINALAGGTNFGTSAISATVSATAANGALNLRNNILVNTSLAKGTGLTVSYRRSGTALNNFTSSSNNNIFYAGTPSATNLVFTDGTNFDQTLAAYQTRVAPRDAASFTELPPFISTIGSSPDFLHVDPNTATQAESGAVNIATYTDDFDGDIRQGNPGYTGAGSAPDIGADEIANETNPPVIIYTLFPSSTCTTTDRTLTGVTITDATGVPLSGSNRPRIYYRKNTGSWFSQPGTNTGGTAQSSTWNFTIVVSDMGGVTGGDVVRYYIIAQDLMPTPNVGSNPSAGLVASSVNSVTTPPTTPKTYTLLYTLNGTYTVGLGGDFTQIAEAVAAYNSACSLAGPVIFELIDNSYPFESYPIFILNHVDASATKTLTIRPSLTATPVFGVEVSDVGPSVFRLSNARHVIIDGRKGGVGSTKSMTLFNLTFGTPNQNTVEFNSAQHNIIKYCNFKSRTNLSSIYFTGNSDSNTIDNNNISDALDLGVFLSGTPRIGILASSNSLAENNVITNNEILNYREKGIWLEENCNGWMINSNKFFQPVTRIYNNVLYSILIRSGSGYTINNNTIGFANAAGTGTSNLIGNNVTLAGFPTGFSVSGTATNFRFVAIACDLDPAGTASNIDGNTIGGIAIYTSSGAKTQEGMFCGISILNGNANIGTIAGNTIGATTGNNSIYAATTTSGGTVVGIYTNSTGTISIQNNNIGGITASGTASDRAAGITAINTEGTANYTISNNFIGNADSGNLRMGLATSGALLSSTGTLVTTTGTGVAFKGIECSSTGNIRTVTGNTFRGWSSSSTKAGIKAVISSGTMTGIAPVLTINNNFFGTAATVWGNTLVTSDSLIAGVYVEYGNESVLNIKYNDFRGMNFNTGSNGLYGIILQDTTAANNVTSIIGNTFTNLAINTYYLSLISVGAEMGNNAISNIDSNITVGTFSFVGSYFSMIGRGNNNSAGLLSTISYNEFSNATITVPDDVNSYVGIIGEYITTKESRIEHNSISNVVQTGSYFSGIQFEYGFSILNDTAFVSNNLISNIAVNGVGNFGIFSYSGTYSKPLLMSKNIISNLSLTRVTDTLETVVTGMLLANLNGSVAPFIAMENEIKALSSTIDSSIVAGILVYNVSSNNSYRLTFNGNKIYDLSVTKPGSRVAGIYSYLYEPLGFFGGRRISMFNNIVGDLRAPTAGSATQPSIAGLLIENNTVKDTIDIFHNTIDLRTSSSNSSFSTAALFTDTLANINSYGNIFNNISTPGSTGKTVAYWRRGANLTNFDGDYNSLYAGTPATNRLIYFDGSNSDQTLAAYKTRVGATREFLSVTELPVFVSTTGNNSAYLHLDPNANCGLIGKADNIYDINEVHFDFDNDQRPNWYFFHIGVDIGADETAKFNTWTGANSTSWNDQLNWSLGTVPNGTDRKVSIPAAPSNQPVIGAGEIFQVRDISVGTGASLTNMGTLKVAGNISGAVGGINNTNAGIVVGSIEMNGLCSKSQTLNGNRFTGNDVKNLTVTTEVTIPATAGQGINLWGALNFGASLDTLKTNGNLTLKSTVASTASVAEMLTGNFINGDVTVERYIHTGTTGGAHTKTWQFLSTPTTGQTIRQAWQENGTSPAGFGTIITGTGTGFDITTALPSMKFFNDVAVNWTAVTNTNNALLNKLGYMLFVRGDRTVNTSGATPNNTVLRSKGTLFQPSNPPPSVAVTANKFQAFGNPYASRIEFSKVRATSTGINDVFYVWDPKLAGNYNVGGYQTITGVAGYVPTVGTPPTGNPATVYYPAGVPAPFIESGQAVFVKGNGTGGNVNFNETVKAAGSRLVNRPGNGNNELANRGFIIASLFTNTGNIADGNIVAFEEGLGNELNELDALKIMNGGENFGIIRSDSLLAVEARNRVMKHDTIFYHLQNLKKLPYQFRFAPVNMRREGLQAYLIDRFNNSSTDVSLTDSSFINFTITEDIRSQAAERFILVFKKAKQGPVKSTTPKESQEQARSQNKDITQTKPDKSTIAVYPNPVVDQQINIRFSNMAKGNYRIEVSNKQGQVVYTGSKYIDQQNTTHTIKTNSVLASGSYQLSVVAEDGERMVESVVVK